MTNLQNRIPVAVLGATGMVGQRFIELLQGHLFHGREPFVKGASMEAEQVQWASQLREIPIRFRQALRTEDDRAIRHHPAMGEWSAIEVLGHMIDKMALWSSRIERIWQEERPSLPDYDQDAGVHDQGYQQADPAVLCEHLEHRCERFAALVVALPASALQREGVHGVFGPMTIRQFVQAAVESAPEHLAQLCAAQEAALAFRTERTIPGTAQMREWQD